MVRAKGKCQEESKQNWENTSIGELVTGSGVLLTITAHRQTPVAEVWWKRKEVFLSKNCTI